MSEMDQFKDLYLQSAREHLGVLNDVLLRLESEKENADLVEELMRAGHSLKGESGAMGFEKMAELGHVVEDLFTAIGNGKMQMTSELADVLFSAFDHLSRSVDSIAGPDGKELDCSDFVAKIKGMTGLTTGVQAVKPASDPAPTPSPVPATEPVVAANPTEQVAPTEVTAPEVPVADAVVEVAPVATPAEVITPEVSLTVPEPSAEVTPAEVAVSESPVTAQAVEGAEALQPSAELAQETPASPEVVAPATAEAAPSNPVPPVQDSAPIVDAAAIAKAGEVPISAADVAALVASAGVPVVETPVIDFEAVKEAAPPKAEQISTVSLKVEKLDQLMSISEELVLLKMKLKNSDVIQENTALKAEVHRLDRLVTELQFQVMQARLFPISLALHTLPRLTRDTAKKLGRKVALVIEGEDTTVDRTIIDHLTEPFVHMIRNAIDHGIENPGTRVAAGKPDEATITISAYTTENRFCVDIKDDGQGIEWKKLAEAARKKGVASPEQIENWLQNSPEQLLFQDGVSASDSVTDISGRGVGLSAVQKAIKRLGGTVEVFSEPGIGTVFTLKLPMTLAIMQALLVSIDGQRFAMPAMEVARSIMLSKDMIQAAANSDSVVVDDQNVPLFYLSKMFQTGTPATEGEDPGAIESKVVVLVRRGDTLMGCVVDRIDAEEEVLVKQLGPLLKKSPFFSGATILADGAAVPIINIEGILQANGVSL